ncbi:MAG TPA: DUF3152 domain-containing protein [Micromonosporaceae bacterium]
MAGSGLAAPDLPGPDLAAAEPVAAAVVAGSVAVARAPMPAFASRPAADANAASASVGAVSYPRAGTGEFGYATGTGPVLGSAGSVLRYHVAVEEGTGQSGAGFADEVDTILGDPHGWALDGLRFQRVPHTVRADFTIYLASPVTSAAMCAVGGLYTEEYTSCRLPGQVIINLARWLDAVPDYGAPLDVYRAYALNHETGHELGYGHEACPAPDRPAPVMQQQTYGLQGCVANGWPYLGGLRYTGPPVP